MKKADFDKRTSRNHPGFFPTIVFTCMQRVCFHKQQARYVHNAGFAQIVHRAR